MEGETKNVSLHVLKGGRRNNNYYFLIPVRNGVLDFLFRPISKKRIISQFLQGHPQYPALILPSCYTHITCLAQTFTTYMMCKWPVSLKNLLTSPLIFYDSLNLSWALLLHHIGRRWRNMQKSTSSWLGMYVLTYPPPFLLFVYPVYSETSVITPRIMLFV